MAEENNLRIHDLEKKSIIEVSYLEWQEFDSDGVSSIIKKFKGRFKRHDLFKLIKKFEELDNEGLFNWEKSRKFL